MFQGWIATSLFYGDNFYVRRSADLTRLYLFKLLVISIPVHVVYLFLIFWLDRKLPELKTKAIIFIPVLAVGFAIESIQMRTGIDRFKPSETSKSEGQMLGS